MAELCRSAERSVCRALEILETKSPAGAGLESSDDDAYLR